ncbi:MAG: hydantoinase/oxoprolinase family protein [Actinobacteria bacterium]|nr:hydantoinase/oxoprolinase family protein [Actinomycetota bacterium]
MSEQARAGVDVGGTFTDVVVLAEGQRPRAIKTPTTVDNQAVGVETGVDEGHDGDLALVAHGTTTATNAVLERKVARTVLVTTDGFADVLEIARQDRPALYDLTVTRPAPLVPRDLVVTVDERTGPDGEAVRELTDDEIDRVCDAVAGLEPESVAVSLLFAYADDTHERRLCEALADRIGVPVTRSSALLAEFREFERGSTCALNAAVEPVMRRYLSNLAERLPDPVITVMTSGGGTAGIEFAARAPVHSLLSGPAAGVVAAGAIARSAGFDDAIAFDMGGTSSDVCLIRDGQPDVSTSSEIDGLPFRTPAVGVHTVGAGGGSIAYVDAGGALRVGPESAGAQPGPACYGKGGDRPTVTDAHAALGHLDPERQLGGGLQLDIDAARRVLADLPDDTDGAHGVLRVVRATMVRALRKVSTERGVDPSTLALIAYGGAGPMHASALARELGCAAVVIPPAPGVLSALGLLLASPRYEASRTVMADSDADLSDAWAELEKAAGEELERQGVASDVTLTRIADARYAGQSHELRLEVGDGDDIADLLHEAHTAAYGYAMTGEDVKVVTLRAVAEGRPALEEPPADWEQGEPAEARSREIGVEGETVQARVVSRAGLSPGDRIEGPALVEQRDTTTLLAPGDVSEVDDANNLVVRFDG